MNKENCALKLVDEIILYYDARLKKHQIVTGMYPEPDEYRPQSQVPFLQHTF